MQAVPPVRAGIPEMIECLSQAQQRALRISKLRPGGAALLTNCGSLDIDLY